MEHCLRDALRDPEGSGPQLTALAIDASWTSIWL